MSSHEPELLESGPDAPASGHRRTTIVSAGVISVVAVLGGGAYAASWYLSSGPVAAEMLPATTRAYVEVDLDPSGGQKIDALRTLRKFPALKRAGIGSTDDLRQKAWQATGQQGTCHGVDYDRDIKPWLGDRMAVADVPDATGADAPVVVAQVSDQAAAKAGIRRILACSTGATRTYGVVFSRGWAVIAESTAEAQRVVDQTGRAALSADAGYQRLMGRVGGAGVLSAYVAPGATHSLSRLIDGERTTAEMSSGDRTSLAVQVRFTGSGLEAEYAGTGGSGTGSGSGTAGRDSEAVTGLPADTGAAVGGSLAAGWGDRALDALATGWHTSRAALVRTARQYTGLSVPADLETLLGRSFAFGVSADGDGGLPPVGLRVVGDPGGVDRVLHRLRGSGVPSGPLRSVTSGDRTGIGPDAAWDAELARTGTLGESATFRRVVPDAEDASSVLYLDAAAHDGWLVRALAATGVVPSEVTDNLRPIAAVGASSTRSGATEHGVLRLTTR